ncbi:bifunctional pyr operon transcriptional regulator/uracil phosphoribosyltransferase PyrR [Hahella sp. SMD15-11]|uniref:Bifunctional pyr operon transcriptional regulator/uracil phosphoribosyltransferase PyrR n=1 Tax=Thermohahella caldifontis TaxID=3142973 RepID=A0AB39UV00_9GAMM
MTNNLEFRLAMETLTERVRHLVADWPQPPVLVGIRTGGVWVANALREALGWEIETGELDISFYRDDFSRNGLNPTVRPSRLSDNLDDRTVLLVDDVIMSGRTIRAAMNELFDYGRPACIRLATLVDLGRRELPIQPDAVGVTLQLAEHERVKLTGPDPLALELRTLNS